MANDLLKKPGVDVEFTPEKILELKKCINDPIYFIKNYVKITHPARGAIPFKLFEYQERFITHLHKNIKTIFKLPRQCGKTQMVSAYILWYSIFRRNKNSLIGSKNLEHAVEIMDRIKFSYENLPDFLKPGVMDYNKKTIKFENGSSIRSMACTSSFGRGYSASMILVDEISYIPKRVQNDMWASILPAISNNPTKEDGSIDEALAVKLCLTSTPNGDDDLYATIWRGAESGQNTFKPFHCHYYEHPDRGPNTTYLQDMIKDMGETRVRIEILCEFLSASSLLCDTLKLSQIKNIEPIWSSLGFKFWEPENQIGGSGKTYMVSIDPATGSGNDFSVVEVFEFPSLKQIAEFRSNDLNIPIFYSRIKWILKFLTRKINNQSAEVLWTFERNGIGEAISALYFNDEDQIEEAELLSEGNGKFGVFTSAKSKVLFCLQLKTLVEKVKNGLDIKSDILISELKNFESKGNSYSAKPGMTDDCAMATVGVMRLLKRLSEYNEDAFTVVNEYIDSDKDLDMDSSGEPMPFFVV